ncbi:MAG: ammonium transporter [Deltaproteobacteria bacterium]|nr:ammonium transporter [Deltaproteobacteria bacterium]
MEIAGYQALCQSADVLFLMLGAVMIFSMHAGFAFLEVGSVRHQSQVNALNKIIFEWAISTVVYFTIGFPIAYGIKGFNFWQSAETLATGGQVTMVRFFLLLGFAACIPAIISGGIAERAKFWTNTLAGAVLVGLAYPLFEAAVWGQLPIFGQNSWLTSWAGLPFHDYAGSVVVHSLGGWFALPAVLLLGPRMKRYTYYGDSAPIKVSSIPFLALGSWILCVGWFGFNVMSAGSLGAISSLVAINSLMAMVGGIISGMLLSRNDAGFTHNGALAGLVAVCAGSDLFHPAGALAVGAIAGAIFVFGYQWVTERLKIDDVLGVWPLHGLCGSWGGLAAGLFGLKVMGGRGGVSFVSQLVGTGSAILYAFVISSLIYGVLKMTVGIRLSEQEEMLGPDLAIHHVESRPEEAL